MCLSSRQVRVVRGRIFKELLGTGCYLARVSTWAARISWATRTPWRTAQGNGRMIFCLGTMIVSATSSAVVLVIGGVQKNPGHGVEAGKIMQVLCSGCDRNLKSGTRVDAGSVTAVVMLQFK